MKSDEQCEEWIAEANRRIEKKGFIPLTSHTMEWMRAAWKASRESLMVELPEKYSGPVNDFYGMGFDTGISKCRKAIHASGVKAK